MSFPNKNTLLLIAVTLLALYLFSTFSEPSRVAKPDSTSGSNSQTESIQMSVANIFTEQSLYKQLNHVHTQTSDKLSAIDETLGSGVCTFDYDNDGWVDVFFVGGSGHTRHYGKDSWWHSASSNALFRNIQGKRFEDVTDTSGLSRKAWGMGCASADLDNDGDSDLLISTIGKNLLFRNNADGTFTDVTQSSGLSGEHWSTSIAIADYDKDGLLDIYIGNYIDYKKGARTFEFNAGFESTLPVSFNPSLYNSVANQLYRNRGNLGFEETASLANVDDPAGRTLSTAWLDINNDNRPDLLITNDKGSPSQLFVNSKDGKFYKAGTEYRVETTDGGHSSVAGNFNNDQYTDLVVSTPTGQAPLVLINDGASLADVAWDSGVARSRDQAYSGWGNALADFNNDGWLDLYLANGLITPDSNTPYVAQGQNDQVLLNSGNGRFMHVISNTNNEVSSRGVAYADYDNDGDIDLFVTNNNNTPGLLTNESDYNNWLGIELINKQGNKEGLDAKIEIVLGQDELQKKITRDNYSRTSFLSHSENRFHFGIGSEEIIAEINVTWSEGNTSSFSNIPANQYIRIDEESNALSGIVFPVRSPSKERTKLNSPFDKHRAEYLIWQAIAADFTNDMNELFDLFVKSDESDQLKLLSLLESIQTPEILPLLHHALSVNNDAIKLNAIKQIEKQEYEPSVYWLLNLFADESVDVKCQTANTFKFFFREEEAVTHRKFLAIPHLVRLLDDTSDQVKLCALDALSEAERYRGINTIQGLLKNNTDTVRIAAIETLGKIRERKYLSELTRLIQSDEESAEILAHTLIALKRLNDINIDDYLKKLISLEKNKTGPEQLYNAIMISNSLLSNNDNVVISPDKVNQLLLSAIEDYQQANSLLSLDKNPSLLEHYFRALSYGHNPNNVTLINPFTKSEAYSVRVKAYEALINNGTTQAILLSETGLFDSSAQVKNAVYKAMNEKHISISDTSLEKLLFDKVDLSVISRLSGRNQQTLISQYINDFISSQTYDETALVSLLKACYESNIRNIVIPDIFFEHQNKELALAAISCAAQNNTQINAINLDEIITNNFTSIRQPYTFDTINALFKSKAAWSKKFLLSLFNHSQVDADINKYIISTADKIDEPNKPIFFIKAVNSSDIGLKEYALNHIHSMLNNKNIQNILYNLFVDEAEDEEVRLKIADLLIPYKPEILDYMRE